MCNFEIIASAKKTIAIVKELMEHLLLQELNCNRNHQKDPTQLAMVVENLPTGYALKMNGV